MMLAIKKYVGYITDSKKNIANCLVIDKNKVATAAHAIKDGIQNFVFHYENIVIPFDRTAVTLKKNWAIINFDSEICESFQTDELKFNVCFMSENDENTKWDAFGFLPVNEEVEFRCLEGESFYGNHGKYPVNLMNCKVRTLSVEGLSGSPVTVNDMVIGILQAQDLNNDEFVDNLYLSPVGEIMEELNQCCIQTDVFSNLHIDRTDYSETFCIDDYIPRKAKHWEKPESEPAEWDDLRFGKTLMEIIRGHHKERLVVLLGEAGSGKSFELQQLAIDLYHSEYVPLFYSLKDCISGERLEEQIPGLKRYILHKIPFCLILDGYDEIKNTSFRDTEFPSSLSGFVSRINEEYKATGTEYVVVISSRKNYYYDGKINQALVVDLCELTLEDVCCELDRRGIDRDSFFAEANTKRLYSLLFNPFYLRYIIKLYLAEGGKLPQSRFLMKAIIDHLFQDKNFEKFRGQPLGLTKENTKGKNILRKLSACYIVQGKMKLSSDEIVQLTDGFFTERDMALVESSGIIEKDGEDNWFFKHNNFCEYLAAEFFSKFSLEQLLDIIAYENRAGIYNNYLNMVGYLLQIRDNTDLSDWIIENCPNTYYRIESKNMTEDRALEVLQSVNRLSNEKGYFILFDYDLPIAEIINNKSCIDYLLSILQNAKTDLELTNAVRLLAELKNLCGMDNDIRAALLSLLLSGKCNANLTRDIITALADLKLGNSDVTCILLQQVGDSTEKEIARGINYYSYTYDTADVFINNLIFQLHHVDYSHYIGAYYFECLKMLKEERSIIKLFAAIMKLDNVSGYFSSNSEIRKVLESYDERMVGIWEHTRSEALIQSVLELSCFLINCYAVRDNLFSGFLNLTNQDESAIEYYYDQFSRVPVLFVHAAEKLNSYPAFLLSGYSQGRFLEGNNFLFNYCLRGFDKDSVTRNDGLSIIHEKNYDDAAASIDYITHNDNYLEKERSKREQTLCYVHDFSKLKNDICEIADESGAENPRCGDLFDYVYNNHEYNTRQYVTFEFSRDVFYRDNTIQENIEYYEKNTTEWLFSSFNHFVSEYSDYSGCLTQEKVESILNQAEEYISDLDLKRCKRHMLESAVLLLQRFDYSLSEENFLKLMRVPEYYFGKYSAKGFPDYLTKHLSSDIIIHEIERLIEANDLNPYLCESCISYCDSESYISESTVLLAKRILCNEFSKDNHYSAWSFLCHNKRIDIIKELILNGTINIGFAIHQFPTLADFYDCDLIELALSLFTEFNDVYLSGIDEDNVAELSERYSYLIRYDNMDNKVENLKSNILDAIRCLYKYLFIYEVENCIDLYLDDMIEKKEYSYLETESYHTLTAHIHSIRYLDKLMIVLQMLCDGTFTEKHEIPFLYQDIRTAILNIGKIGPDETIECLSVRLSDPNIDYRRSVSLLYDEVYKGKYENMNKVFSIEETRQIVFT